MFQFLNSRPACPLLALHSHSQHSKQDWQQHQISLLFSVFASNKGGTLRTKTRCTWIGFQFTHYQFTFLVASTKAISQVEEFQTTYYEAVRCLLKPVMVTNWNQDWFCELSDTWFSGTVGIHHTSIILKYIAMVCILHPKNPEGEEGQLIKGHIKWKTADLDVTFK